MESYQLTPDLAAACEQDITANCQKKLEAGGRTVHCLMKHMKGPKKISDQCRREVEKMVKVSGMEPWILFESVSSSFIFYCPRKLRKSCREYSYTLLFFQTWERIGELILSSRNRVSQLLMLFVRRSSLGKAECYHASWTTSTPVKCAKTVETHYSRFSTSYRGTSSA